MSDLINRQDAIDAVKELCEHYTPTKSTFHPHIDFVVEELERLPSVLPRKGKWITKSTDGEFFDCCSSCGYVEWYEPKNFCTNCGADMRNEAREYLEYGKLIAKGIEQGLRGDSDEKD